MHTALFNEYRVLKLIQWQADKAQESNLEIRFNPMKFIISGHAIIE